MKPLTVRALAKKYGLSRSILLYYDRRGLLTPSTRSEAGYRLYSPTDVARLERIVLYRDAGLPLEAIRPLLDAPTDRSRDALAARLVQINHESMPYASNRGSSSIYWGTNRLPPMPARSTSNAGLASCRQPG